jgi:DNA-directed RNA polymerase subunit E'/Rpb7
MKLVSPYHNIKQHTKILIEPYHMNSDIKNNMKNILKKKVEKKCNVNGYIEEVYRILKYSDGFMPAENLTGSAIYDIKYHCKICIPVENSIIIGLVKVINQELIIASNGCILIFIPKENIDTNIWDISENFLNKITKNKLAINTYIKIQIIDKRINNGDPQIKAIGMLLDIPTEEEVEKFYGVKVIIVDKNIKQIDLKNNDDKYNNNSNEYVENESNFII